MLSFSDAGEAGLSRLFSAAQGPLPDRGSVLRQTSVGIGRKVVSKLSREFPDRPTKAKRKPSESRFEIGRYLILLQLDEASWATQGCAPLFRSAITFAARRALAAGIRTSTCGH